MTPAHFVEVRIGVKIMTDRRIIEVDFEKLTLLLDRTSDVFIALDSMGKAYDDFVKTTFVAQSIPQGNVIDLSQKRLEKDPNEIYNNKGDT